VQAQFEAMIPAAPCWNFQNSFEFCSKNNCAFPGNL
jgi:hypothetical protein